MTGRDLDQRDGRADERRRLDLLEMIALAGGALLPKRDPAAKGGHDFGLAEPAGPNDLKYLAERDYLEERYFDRVSICPKCSSHFLNVREVCPACGSTHYSEEPLLHHFRCGYVGRASEFAAPDGSGKRICPKCATQLRYLGTDHDQLGRTFLCIDCGTSFQDAPVSGMCLSCATETPAADLSSLEISSYSLTSLGAAALRRGSLFEAESEALFVGARIYRPTVMREMLEQEARRNKRYKTSSSLLLARFQSDLPPAEAEDAEADCLARLGARMRESDIVGRLADRLYAVCMPQTPLKSAQLLRAVVARFAPPGTSLETSVVEIANPADLAQSLATYRLK
jgi:hypothetical protein